MNFNIFSKKAKAIVVTEKVKPTRPLSQNERIIKMLRESGSLGVRNYQFPENRILRYSARINELRADGYDITCTRLELPNGRKTGVFIYHLNEFDE